MWTPKEALEARRPIKNPAAPQPDANGKPVSAANEQPAASSAGRAYLVGGSVTGGSDVAEAVMRTRPSNETAAGARTDVA